MILQHHFTSANPRVYRAMLDLDLVKIQVVLSCSQGNCHVVLSSIIDLDS
eukprot:Gb_12106 [translate_table: standard]